MSFAAGTYINDNKILIERGVLTIFKGLSFTKLVIEQKSKQFFESCPILFALNGIGNGLPFPKAKTSGLSNKPGQIPDDNLDFNIL